jgi:hypothetical protein
LVVVTVVATVAVVLEDVTVNSLPVVVIALAHPVATLVVSVVVSMTAHHKATASVTVVQTHALLAVQTTPVTQAAMFAKAGSMTVTAVAASLLVVILRLVLISRHAKNLHLAVSAAILRHVATSHHVKSLLPVVTLLPVKTLHHAVNVATLHPVAISPTANPHSENHLSPNPHLPSQQPNQATAAKCSCHAIWLRKYVRLRLSNRFSFLKQKYSTLSSVTKVTDKPLYILLNTNLRIANSYLNKISLLLS